MHKCNCCKVCKNKGNLGKNKGNSKTFAHCFPQLNSTRLDIKTSTSVMVYVTDWDGCGQEPSLLILTSAFKYLVIFKIYFK